MSRESLCFRFTSYCRWNLPLITLRERLQERKHLLEAEIQSVKPAASFHSPAKQLTPAVIRTEKEASCCGAVTDPFTATSPSPPSSYFTFFICLIGSDRHDYSQKAFLCSPGLGMCLCEFSLFPKNMNEIRNAWRKTGSSKDKPHISSKLSSESSKYILCPRGKRFTSGRTV